MSAERRFHPSHLWRAIGLLVSIALIVSAAWWAVGRLTLDSRRVVVRTWDQAPAAPADSMATLRILAWNIAHGRGDVGLGLLRNYRGGSAETRIARLARIAEVVRRTDPDLIVLNEVDFDSHWSGGLNQAEVLARALGYPTWVELRNYDLRLPFYTLSFGNAVLSRLPVLEARRIGIPPHSGLEALVIGAKDASLIRVRTPVGPLAIVPVHLEFRSEETRLAAVPVLDSVLARESAPTILAGDFNSAPSGWPGAEGETALDAFLSGDWTSRRAEAAPAASAWTYPSSELARSIDWILVGSPLRVRDAEVVGGARELSDHLPVMAVVRLPDRGGP